MSHLNQRMTAKALADAQRRAAPPGNIATAARAFGDRFPPLTRQWRVRAAGALVLATMLAYLPWMLSSLNTHAWWLAVPFAAANLLSAACAALSVINNWQRRVTPPRLLAADGHEPAVGVIIPTCGEPVAMVLRTVLSVLDQDYPASQLVVLISDDAHNPELAIALSALPVHYYDPPALHAPGRDGAAKAGNLNAALAHLTGLRPDVRFVETRDADDELGSELFLRQCVGQMLADERLAFVQTIKETQVSAGDPFNNRDSAFFRSQMLARNAADAAFPCGSGLLWRRAAIDAIGGFPTWNLVEDLQSGVEALRRGWKGCYLPIVGAVGQHSPEDVANVYKQRGTWAIDNVRLMLWGDTRGLRLRQRLQFTETALFYWHSLTTLVYVPSVAAALLGVMPLHAHALGWLQFLAPYALAMELWLLILAVPYNDRRKVQRDPLRQLFRQRVMWIGMAPVYIRAVCLALAGGPRRKPVYRVTRKTNELRWHWRETLPQLALVATVPAAFVIASADGTLPAPDALLGAAYWGAMHTTMLASFVTRGWFGVRAAQRERVAAALNAAAPARTSGQLPAPARA